MILRLAVRSLATRPLRTAVLAVGFGLGIAVMAELLGVGEVILEQAHAPALQGGGDLVIRGAFGTLDHARWVLSSILDSDRYRTRTTAAAPSRRGTAYLIAHGREPIAVSVRAGIPSLEKAVGDPEVAGQAGWVDTPADTAWSRPTPGDVLRAIDRFHPAPAIGSPQDSRETQLFSQASWAEWLYFNGRTPDGRLRFYLTFLAGGTNAAGKRPTIVRLQLDRDGRTTNYSSGADVDARDLFERAPDLDVAGSSVRLDGLQYRIKLALQREGQSDIHNPKSAMSGEITLDAAPGRSMPPATIRGARGWVSGYVVPVLSGTFRGTLRVDGVDVSVDGASGYHDHNWGYWEGVRWQWGQVAGGDLSIVYGRVFPPAAVADADRIPGFLAVLGPDGPIAFSTDVTIEETDEGGIPRAITVHARGRQIDLDLSLDVTENVQTRLSLTRGAGANAMGFLQLGGTFTVTGTAAGRAVKFSARGSAETFRY